MADSKKKKESEIPIIKEQEQIENLLKKYKEKGKTEEPPKERFDFKTREFKEFERAYFEAQVPRTFFEKACRFAGNHLKIGIKKKDEKKMGEILYFTGLHIAPQGVISLSILVFLIFLILSGALIIFSFPISIGLFIIGLTLLIAIQKYPNYLQKIQTVETLNSMPLAITYLVIFMRSSPELEGAVRFAAKHLTGPLARDLRKMIWDLENGVYLSMEDALTKFSEKWKEKNKHFSTAIELIKNSERISEERERLAMLDEAASVILKGNLDTMKTFARNLRMPVMVLYMLGIVLPVMGLVLAPVMTTLLAKGLSATSLILTYNLLLPAVIYIMIKSIMTKRPGGFSRPDIRGYPGIAPPGHIRIGKHNTSLIPFSILAFLVIGFPGILLLFQPSKGYSLARVIKSITLILGISAAIIIYTLGDSRKKLKIRQKVEDIEEGLDAALYQLSERIAMGEPLETAIEEASLDVKTGPMRGLFAKISMNMKNLGVTLDRAIFDEEFGALRYYPSKLLRTVMEVMVESTKKGLSEAANSLRTIGHFVSNLKEIKEEILEMIGKTISSMKFQAQFLTSFISGVIIALDILLFKILSSLGQQVSTFSIPQEVSTTTVTGIFQNSMFNVASVIPAEQMQIIVGAYMIEVTILLSMLINGVMNGRDRIFENYTIGTNLLTSTIIYTISLVVGTLLFVGFKIGM